MSSRFNKGHEVNIINKIVYAKSKAAEEVGYLGYSGKSTDRPDAYDGFQYLITIHFMNKEKDDYDDFRFKTFAPDLETAIKELKLYYYIDDTVDYYISQIYEYKILPAKDRPLNDVLNESESDKLEHYKKVKQFPSWWRPCYGDSVTNYLYNKKIMEDKNRGYVKHIGGIWEILEKEGKVWKW